ncbi:MAG: rod shape-determining protein RodA [bacterium]|nr:rod shape-determining protein RodA [bacterium]
MLKNLDWYIIISILVLAGFSLAIINSVYQQYFFSQLIFYLAGFILYLLFANIDYQIFRPFWLPIYFITCALLLVTFIVGVESRGAVRWIEIAGFRLQLSEVFKPFLLLAFASYLADHPPRKFKDLFFSAVFCLLPFFLVLKQPDLGSSVVYAFAFFGMIFVAGIPLKYLVSFFSSFLVALPLLWHFLKSYQKDRILSFLNPTADPTGTSYNAIQAMIAVGSGQIFGKGLGHGTQSQLLFLPERHTDFIFSSFIEELGLVGGLVLLAAFAMICHRIIRLINKDTDTYGNNFLAGALFLLVAQLFINVGMNLGVLPITGITLPLVSYGGSSLLATMIILGIIANIAKSGGNNVQLGNLI